MLSDVVGAFVPRAYKPKRYLTNLVFTRSGGRVVGGPFAGTMYLRESVGSALIPKLLGMYERELADVLEEACGLQLPLILDIGAAEGYYAIGLARRNPQARVVAFEADDAGCDALRRMADLNGVSGQIEILGRCEIDHLKAIVSAAGTFLVICDIEGYEDVLLQPELMPALDRAYIIVETHDAVVPGVTERIRQRFAASHDIRTILPEPRDPSEFPYRSLWSSVFPRRYLDWAVSEWRTEQTPWLWMKPRAGGRPARVD